jgi:stage V sporulation protein S
MEVLKVASRSNPNSVSSAIIGAVGRDGAVELHAIGAGAVNQTVKAIAIARRLVEKPGEASIRIIPGFMDVVIDGQPRTGMRFIVER